MPTKGPLTTDGILYSFDGETYTPLARISDIPEVTFEPEEDSPFVDLIHAFDKFSVTVEVAAHSINMLKATVGLAMPNNWLKMHGFPMKRKKYRKGRK